MPVDIVLVPKDEKVETITSVSPDEWFDSQTRDDWPYIQSLSFSESDVRKTIKVKLKKTKKTTHAVIFADFRGLSDVRSQMAIFNSESKENEDIFITINGLLY